MCRNKSRILSSSDGGNLSGRLRLSFVIRNTTRSGVHNHATRILTQCVPALTSHDVSCNPIRHFPASKNQVAAKWFCERILSHSLISLPYLHSSELAVYTVHDFPALASRPRSFRPSSCSTADPNSLLWPGDPGRLVNAAEVVPDCIERDHVRVVLKLHFKTETLPGFRCFSQNPPLFGPKIARISRVRDLLRGRNQE